MNIERQILENLFSNIKIPSNTKGIDKNKIIEALLKESESNFANQLGYSRPGDGGFKRFRDKLIPNKPSILKSYLKYYLFLAGYFSCSSCKQLKVTSDFYYSEDSMYKLTSLCKECDATRFKDKKKQKVASKNHYLLHKKEYLERNIQRNLRKERATPRWANREKLKEIYNNCPTGFHVDHIIPLHGVLVSGLHVPENLQYLSAEENLSKSNKFYIE